MQPPIQTTLDGVSPPALLAAADALFARRAARLATLADGHPHAEWLRWLGRLCQAQHRASELAAAGEAAEDALAQVLRALAAPLAADCPEALRPALRSVAALGPDALHAHAERNLAMARGEYSSEVREPMDLLVAAALQVHWTAAMRGRVARVPAQEASNSPSCPCCGSAPLGGIVLAGAGKAGLRYLECSLCGTRWNAVRARCTLCEHGAVVNYLGLEGQPATQAETCDACEGYIKVFFQDKDIALEPLADDLATLPLDILVAEQGYARGAPNLFLEAICAG